MPESLTAKGLGCALLMLVLGWLAQQAAIGSELPRHEGVASCASSACHGRAMPDEDGPILRNEYVTWSRFDPHAQAYATLRSPRSQAIAARLGLQSAHEARECLDCHSNNVPEAARGPRFQPDDGIGCEGCHGGAEHWLASHYDVPNVTRASNIANGLVPLDDPSVRAGVCLRCHVGDAGNYFVTHRIMAAGHPRLGFELDTFSEIWRTSGGREHYRYTPAYAERKAMPSSLAVWTAGLVRQARQYLQLVDAHYASSGPLPDFSLFNCYSCHRAMGIGNWQERVPAGAGEPGSLRFDDSTLRMLEAALAGSPSPAAELARRLRQDGDRLQQAVQRGPQAVAEAIQVLSGTLDETGRYFAAEPLNRAGAARVLAELGRRAARGEFPDYVHAEQAAMGLVILREASGAAPGPEVEAVFRTLEDDDRYDPGRFSQAIRRLP